MASPGRRVPPSTLQHVLVALGWAALLAPGVLAFADGGPVRDGLPRALALLLALSVALAFALRCRARRVALALLAVVLALLAAGTDAIDAAAALKAAAAAAAVTLVVEAVRQNAPLLAEWRAARLPLWPVLARSLLLWLPALGFLAIGLAASRALDRAATQAVYTMGLAERHCRLQGIGAGPAGDAVVRCDGLTDPLPPSAWLPLRRAASLAHATRERVAALRLQLLRDSEPLAPWGDGAAAHARRLQQDLERQLRSWLALPDDEAARADERALLAKLDEHFSRAKPLRDDPPLRRLTYAQCLAHGRPEALPNVNMARILCGLIAHLAREHPAGAQRLAADERLRSAVDLPQLSRAVEAAAARPGREERRAAARDAWLRALAGAEARWAAVAQGLPSAEPPPLCRLDRARPRPLDDDDVLPCPGPDAQPLRLQPLPLADDLRLTIDARSRRQASAIEARLLALDAKAMAGERAAAATADDLVGLTPDSLDLERPRCGLDPVCGIGNWIKGRAEARYTEAREAFRSDLVADVQRQARLGRLGAQALIDLARSRLHAQLEAARRQQHAALASLQRGLGLLGTALTIYLLFVAIKSFLYVLALVVFREHGPLRVGFGLPPGPQGRLAMAPSITVPPGPSLWTFGVGINQAKRLRPWKPWVAFWWRLLHARWLMNHGAARGSEPVRFPLEAGRSGVVWTLAPGERVVLRFRELLGFSDDVQVRTEVSLRLSTLLLGGYFFRVAESPADGPGGGLLLFTVGGSGVAADAEVESFPLTRIKAWSRHAAFKVAGEPSLASVLKDGYTLTRVAADDPARGRVVAGSAGVAGMQLEGLASFAKALMSPF